MLKTILPNISLNKKNEKKFLIIVREKIFCIDLMFDLKENIDLEKMFLIIKTYVNAKENLLKSVYIIGSHKELEKNDAKINFFRNLSLKKIEKINFFEFKILYEEMFENDWELYLNNFEFYGLRFFFMKESKIWKTLEFYPEYPFNANLKKMYIYEDENIKKISKIKKENFILKKKILFLLKKRKI